MAMERSANCATGSVWASGIRAICLIVALVLSQHGTAFALDSDADDYSAGALPAGTNLAAAYYQFATRDTLYANGNAVAGGNLDSSVGILRYARFIEIGGFLADPQFLLPFGHLYGTDSMSGLGSSAGIGDLILASTVWLYRNIESGYYFGVTPIVYIPTGDYNPRNKINLGENRWKGGLQAGYVMPIFTKDLTLQLTADVTFYGDNTNYGLYGQTLSQAPMGQFQAWLKYNVTKDFDVRFGASYFIGGETKVDGISNNDETRTANIRAGFAYNFAPSWNIMAVYGRDVAVENGFSEGNRVNLRMYTLF
ncbi:transporter [Xanthobacter sp. AM11]|uniref:transporter n=1 Tax=Xanthobacter sp. AM11 TaxID=3380643 RepID=UPI0039BF853C